MTRRRGGLRFVLAMAGRESRGSRRRLPLLVGALAAGVAALVAINSFTANLRRSVREQSRALLGADLSLSSRQRPSPAIEALLDSIACGGATPCAGDARGRVARVTSFAAMAYVPRTAGARLVQVAAIEGGYPFYGEIRTDPPDGWRRLQTGLHALVDPALLAAIDAVVGDTLLLGEGRFVIAGTLVNFPGEVGIRSAFGPRVVIPGRYLAETKLLGFGARARYEAFVKLPSAGDAERLAARYRPRLAAERVRVRTVAEDQSDLEENLGRLGRYLGLVGLVALLLGGLGVGSTVHAYIRQRMETVAVLRCLGASTGRLLAVYLVQAGALGLLGGVVGAAAGAALQFALPSLLGDFLPVDVTVRLSWPALLAGVGMGLWVALAFALLPLLAVRR
ncbi:MAG TPA: FtsX-like permease family protein, partial [Gemmatimonadales bacterium]|nr:FtsX-like permease family protein [Gemmatimonadales bacterium]